MAELDSGSTAPTFVQDNLLMSEVANATTDAEHEDRGDQQIDLGVTNGDPASNGTIDMAGEALAANVADSKNPAATKKAAMSVTPVGKTNGGPPTPTVKKIINSGTFGAGSVKPTLTKPVAAMTAATSKVTAPPLKKPTVSAPAATSKPTMASSVSKPIPPAASGRRASVLPTKSSAPLMTKPSLSASVNRKPSPDSAPARASVVSPTGSVVSTKGAATPITRPRASVSEAVKKAPLSSRQSLAPPTKPAAPAKASTVTRSSAAPPVKSSRPASSISSIKEVKEVPAKESKANGQALADLQTQLDEANESMKLKNDAVVNLESQIEKLEASLANASADEAKLEEGRNSLVKLQGELREANSALQAVQKALEDAKAAAITQDNLVRSLQSQIQDLEAAVSVSKEKIQSLEQSHSAATSAAEAASIEHEALLKAQADFKSISEEIEALKVAHTQALQQSTLQIQDLEEKLAAGETLQAQVVALKSEKEETANKLSELEVEILELKESQDGLEDTRENLERQISSLEKELVNAAVASALAAEAASGKEAERAANLKGLTEQHEADLQAEKARYADLATSLETLKTQHAEALAAYEQVKHDIVAMEEKHVSSISELEKIHATQQAALSSEIEKIKSELANQESVYNSKVDVVKAEHTQLLEEAFERAKKEAGDIHAQELQTLRAESSATIEQIQNANQVALEAFKSDHATSLETEVNTLTKQINNLSLELKATQDDLSKSKAALEAARAEIETLTKQRDEARALADAVPTLSPEHADEIARLTKELGNTKDDLAAVTDMLNLTKSSMTEMSDNHAKELQDTAKGRADEAIKLRTAHDAEVTALATQKSELLIRLSDLEGELATEKAAAAALQAVVPKSANGNGTTHPPSPSVTKEELTKMHEAHNLKIYDLQAEHEKALKVQKAELETALNKISELQQEVGRKAMEIQYLEQDQDESQEQINRLKEDMETLATQHGQTVSQTA